MNALDKDRALAHYSAMALEASRMVSGSAAQSTGTLHPVFVSILNAAAVRPKGYAWGAWSNVEPPDEAEDRASDRYERDMDARHGA